MQMYLYPSDSEWAFALFLSKVKVKVRLPKHIRLIRFLAPGPPRQVIFHEGIATGHVGHNRDPQ